MQGKNSCSKGRKVLSFDSAFGLRVVVAALTAPSALRVDGPHGPKVLKVLRFDGGFAAEGCGGGLWTRLRREGSEGS